MADPHTTQRAWWWRTVVLVGVLVVLAWSAWQHRPDGLLRVYVADVPGDAVLLQTPRGAHILIDGGAEASPITLFLGRRLPFWKRHLDMVILTSNSDQRIPGQIAALQRYHSRLTLLPGDVSRRGSAGELLALVAQQPSGVYFAERGQTWLVDGVRVRVVAPADPLQRAGLVLEVEHGLTRLTFDLAGGRRDDRALLRAVQHTTVLVYPWQRDPHTPLMARWQPQAVVYSRGYTQPHPPALTMHRRANGDTTLARRMFHPDVNGMIEIISNGRQVLVATQHTNPWVLYAVERQLRHQQGQP